jgi:uncharacterized protein (DUF3820 family)
MSQSTVSFGKYKGQPMSVLMSDKSYLKWCQQQTWFQEKFSDLCDASLTESTQPSVNKTAVIKKNAVKPVTVSGTSSMEDKIKLLEEENKTLMQRIKRNQLEIQKLKSNGDDDNDDSDDDIKPPVKRVGKCLL